MRSKCVKCGNGTFELAENTPVSSKYTFQFVQCSSCGGVAGVVDYMNVGAMLEDQNEALKLIAAKLGVPVRL